MDKYVYSDKELAFMENSDVPFAVYQFINKRVVTLALSKGFIELFGFTEMEKHDVYDLMDNDMYKYTHPDDKASLGDAAYNFATEDIPYDVVYRSKVNDEYRIIHSYGRHIYKENNVKLAFIWYTDQGAYIDDAKSGNDTILNSIKYTLAKRSYTYKVEHDHLTGLPSMSYFFELAEVGCMDIRRNHKTPVILFMNFNGIKGFNRKYGIAEGDKLLKAFSMTIIDIFSHENCSRFTADQFCVFTDEEKALIGAEKLLRLYSSVYKDKSLPVRIGMYRIEDENISISSACDKAKIACDSGRNTYISKLYVFNQDMMTIIENKQYIVENLDDAIKNEWIKVYYQPIIRTANGRVCHEEALARWIDPDKGFLNPGRFIPALEEAQTIYKLDLYVVKSVLKKMKEQADNGLYVVPISVNLSRSDFYACDIVEEIKKLVDANGISRDKLVIEITESTLADNIDFMLTEINRFKALGFSVWMDDYGSGYSSPNILQQIPFDLIKIDMLFVQHLHESEKAKIILTELVRMAMSLDIDTIAEGVETKEQADFLKDIGCTMLQGYYFCKPVSLPDIIKRYDDGIQIGFENPLESEYYTQLGKVNLYNISLSSTDNDKNRDYFDTWPMILLEFNDDIVKVVRANVTYKNYYKKIFPDTFGKTEFSITEYLSKPGSQSLQAVIQCAKDGKRKIIDDTTTKGKKIQLLVWRVAVNPVNGMCAVMVAILSSTESTEADNDALNQMTGKYEKLQKENIRLKEEADAHKKIAELKESVSALLTNMPAMTFSKDVTTGIYIACNQAFADYAHKESPEGVVGLTDYEIFDDKTAKHFIEDDKKALSMEKPYIFYEDVPDAAGNPRRFQTTKLKFIDNTGRQCLLGLCQDITDAMSIKREYVERLAKLQDESRIDALTGIKNKNAYQDTEEIMDHRISEKGLSDFAITVLDINDLKKINDTFGHIEGDRCIREACDIISSIFEESQLFRIGGDEFVVISQNKDYERISTLVNKLNQYNEEALGYGGILIACGMSRYDNDGSVSPVFERADELMYKNKKELKKIQQKNSF